MGTNVVCIEHRHGLEEWNMFPVKVEHAGGHLEAQTECGKLIEVGSNIPMM